MRYALAGLTLLAAGAAFSAPAEAHDRGYYGPRYVYPPPAYYVVPAPRYYYPPPPPRAVYIYPRVVAPYYYHPPRAYYPRPHGYAPRGAATFYFRF